MLPCLASSGTGTSGSDLPQAPLGVLTIVQVDPFHNSARVRLLPATVRNPTARQSLPPQETSCSAEPRPADIAWADFQVVPFQNWLPGAPSVMQLVALAQAIALGQPQVWNPWHSVPMSSGMPVHDLVVAFQVSVTATAPLLTSTKAPPAAIQKAPAQETAFMAAGFPAAGRSSSRDHDFPLHMTATAFCTGS